MSGQGISFQDGMKIISAARAQLAQKAPNWQPAFPTNGAPGDTVTRPGPDNPDWNANSPTDPGMGSPLPGDPPGWATRSGEAEGYMVSDRPGPHNPTLSAEQAHALQLLWLVTGQDGESVGRGFVTPSKNGEK